MLCSRLRWIRVDQLAHLNTGPFILQVFPPGSKKLTTNLEPKTSKYPYRWCLVTDRVVDPVLFWPDQFWSQWKKQIQFSLLLWHFPWGSDLKTVQSRYSRQQIYKLAPGFRIRIRIRIRINLSFWIRIRGIQIADPDPDPGGQKWPTKIEKSPEFSCF